MALGNNDTASAKKARAESAMMHADYMRWSIDKIKAKITLDREKLEEEAWLEDRRRKREEDNFITLSTAKPIIRAV